MGVHHRFGSRCTLDHCGEQHEPDPDPVVRLPTSISLTEEDLAEIERVWQPVVFCSTDASDAVRLVAEVRRLREINALYEKQRDQAEADRAEARQLALEEAAKLCESLDVDYRAGACAQFIRAAAIDPKAMGEEFARALSSGGPC